MRVGGLDFAVHHALLDFELLLRLEQGELGFLDIDLLQIDGVLRGGGIQFHQQVAFLHVAALGHDEDDARGAFDFAADGNLVHGLQGAPLDDGDQEITAFDLVEVELLRRAWRARRSRITSATSTRARGRRRTWAAP